MKKFIIICLLIVFAALSVASCNGTVDRQESSNATESLAESVNEDSNVIDETEEKEEYIFLIEPHEDESEDMFGAFGDAFEHGFGLTAENSELSDLAGDKKIIFDADKDFVYSHSEFQNGNTDEPDGFFNTYHVYKYGQEKVEFLEGSDLLRLYTKPTNVMSASELTKESIQETAELFLNEFIGQDKFGEFTMIGVDTNYIPGINLITYYKPVCGYTTDETIKIMVDGDGEVVGYNGRYIGKYDELQNVLDKDKLDKAAEALLKEIASRELKNCSCEQPVITTNASGDVFLKIFFSYTDSYGADIGETAYVSVYTDKAD